MTTKSTECVSATNLLQDCLPPAPPFTKQRRHSIVVMKTTAAFHQSLTQSPSTPRSQKRLRAHSVSFPSIHASPSQSALPVLFEMPPSSPSSQSLTPKAVLSRRRCRRPSLSNVFLPSPEHDLRETEALKKENKELKEKLQQYVHEIEALSSALVAFGNDKTKLGGQLPIHLIIIHGGAIDFLTTFETQKNMPDNENKTPIHYASEFARSKIIIWLLELDANSIVKDIYNKLALHYIACCSHISSEKVSELIEVTESLLSHNIIKLIPQNLSDEDTAYLREVVTLEELSTIKKEATVENEKALKETLSKQELVDLKRDFILEFNLELLTKIQNEILDSKDNEGKTPLLHSVISGFFEMFCFLLKKRYSFLDLLSMPKEPAAGSSSSSSASPSASESDSELEISEEELYIFYEDLFTSLDHLEKAQQMPLVNHENIENYILDLIKQFSMDTSTFTALEYAALTGRKHTLNYLISNHIVPIPDQNYIRKLVISASRHGTISPPPTADIHATLDYLIFTLPTLPERSSKRVLDSSSKKKNLHEKLIYEAVNSATTEMFSCLLNFAYAQKAEISEEELWAILEKNPDLLNNFYDSLFVCFSKATAASSIKDYIQRHLDHFSKNEHVLKPFQYAAFGKKSFFSSATLLAIFKHSLNQAYGELLGTRTLQSQKQKLTADINLIFSIAEKNLEQEIDDNVLTYIESSLQRFIDVKRIQDYKERMKRNALLKQSSTKHKK